MNFFGIGPFELVIIGLVAFIFLGPERLVEVARFLGRITREVRKMTAEVRDMIDIDELINPVQADETDKAKSNHPDNPAIGPSGSTHVNGSQTTIAPDAAVEPDGPVSFKSARELHREKMEDQAAQEDVPQAEERS